MLVIYVPKKVKTTPVPMGVMRRARAISASAEIQSQIWTTSSVDETQYSVCHDLCPCMANCPGGCPNELNQCPDFAFYETIAFMSKKEILTASNVHDSIYGT